jgi:hypothetical protein
MRAPYIPNFCIAEVFGCFMKYAFGRWNPHVKRKGEVDRRVYRRLLEQFQMDIHKRDSFTSKNCLATTSLESTWWRPIDHHFQFRRGKKRHHRPMGTFDHLIISMGIHLAHIHGADKVAIVSADDRLTDVVSKCKSAIKPATIRKLKLEIAKEVTGRSFSASLFPRHVNLKSAKDTELRALFGVWPLPIGAMPRVYRWLK